MRYGVSGAPVPSNLPYAAVIQRAAIARGTFPLVCYAIAYREAIHGEVVGEWPSAATVIAGDGGTGLFQLTPPPPGIDALDPAQNADAAIVGWIDDGTVSTAIPFWAGLGFTGATLVRLAADEFNEGRTAAWKWHLAGDADLGTTNHYGSAVAALYNALLAGSDLEAAWQN